MVVLPASKSSRRDIVLENVLHAACAQASGILRGRGSVAEGLQKLCVSLYDQFVCVRGKAWGNENSLKVLLPSVSLSLLIRAEGEQKEIINNMNLLPLEGGTL